MYIEPNTIIKIYRGLPLNNDYEHTLYFNSLSEQTNWFMNENPYIVQTLSKESYQRVNKGTLRIGVQADFLYSCNYLAFQNTNYGSKWFYAFITNIEYINNNVSEVSYEIDVVQTYMFNVTFKECYVERCHADNDEIGLNLLPEPIEIGDYIQDGTSHPILKEIIGEQGFSEDNAVIVATSEKYEGGSWSIADGGFTSNCYQGIYLNTFTGTESAITTNVNQFLAQAISDNKSEAIVSVFMCPKYIIEMWADGGDGTADINMNSADYSISQTGGNTIDGYTPKNNKLLTYPYTFLMASDGCGNFQQFRYEWFISHNLMFRAYAQMSCTPSVMVVPLGYKRGNCNTGLIEAPINKDKGDLDSSITIGGFPVCSFSIDSYKAWLAQNQYNLMFGVGTTLLNGIGNALTGNIGGALSSTLSGGLGIAKDVMNASILPASNRGNVDNSNINFACDMQDVFLCRKSIQRQYAECIDNFFTKYGYACDEVKIPPRNNRKEYTYVKTKDCLLIGQMPSDDNKKFCNIMNNGITWWKNPSQVGNYGIDNPPE